MRPPTSFITWIEQTLAHLIGSCSQCGQYSPKIEHIPSRLCAPCWQQWRNVLERDHSPRCAQCAHLIPTQDLLCGECLTTPPEFDYTCAYTDYTDQIRDILRAYKFHPALHLSQLLHEIVFFSLQHHAHKHPAPDIITIVPQQDERLCQRGFDTLHLLMQAINTQKIWTQAPTQYQPELLWRINHTQLQVAVPHTIRRKQVQSAFALNPKHHVRDANIWVIDDIMTTGATLNEVARVLKQAGAKTVHNIVIARTLRPESK